MIDDEEAPPMTPEERAAEAAEVERDRLIMDMHAAGKRTRFIARRMMMTVDEVREIIHARLIDRKVMGLEIGKHCQPGNYVIRMTR